MNDWKIQIEILQEIASSYPSSVRVSTQLHHPNKVKHLVALQQRELVSCVVVKLPDQPLEIESVTLTLKGLAVLVESNAISVIDPDRVQH